MKNFIFLVAIILFGSCAVAGHGTPVFAGCDLPKVDGMLVGCHKVLTDDLGVLALACGYIVRNPDKDGATKCLAVYIAQSCADGWSLRQFECAPNSIEI